jgi:hypothetical protein
MEFNFVTKGPTVTVIISGDHRRNKTFAATIEICRLVGDSCDTMAKNTGPGPDLGEGKPDNCSERQATRSAKMSLE